MNPFFSTIKRKASTMFALFVAGPRVKKLFKEFSVAYHKERGFSLSWEKRLIYLGDATSETLFDAHYTYHPAWAARILSKIKPDKHIDIGSILYFSTMVSAWIPTEYYDYRPANITLSNLTSGYADLTKLHFKDRSVQSISCMHTIEHIGLGRYGDPIDPDGDLKAINELQRVTSPGGTILFVVPIGTPTIVFNAHRIYSYEQIRSYFDKDCTLREFYLIPDNAQKNSPIEHATREDADKQSYGCGCFWFEKRK